MHTLETLLKHIHALERIEERVEIGTIRQE
jgi:hypothetical protein